ncbi:MAG: EAL domain-containing protein [Ferrimonas sp.]
MTTLAVVQDERINHNALALEQSTLEHANKLVAELKQRVPEGEISVWVASSDAEVIPIAMSHPESAFVQLASFAFAEHSNLFQHLTLHGILKAEAARLHPATQIFNQTLLIPNGIHSLLFLSLKSDDKFLGFALIEFKSPSRWDFEVTLSLKLLTDSFAQTLSQPTLLTGSGCEFIARNAVEHGKLNLCVIEFETNNIVYANKNHARFLGKDLSEIIGTNYRSYSALTFEPEWINAVHEQLANNQQASGEIQLHNSLGEARWFDFKIDLVEVDGERYLSVISEDITESQAQQEEIERLYWHCHLTRLPNRIKFLHDQQHTPYNALLLVDIDDFRSINDHYGLDVGDWSLQYVANSLLMLGKRLNVSQVYRIGAGEFVVAFNQYPELGLQDIAGQIQRHYQGEQVLRGQRLTISVSLAGLDLSILTGELTPLAALDLAILEAQKNHRYCEYDLALQTEHLNAIQLQSELKVALSRRELKLYYQPLISNSSMEVVGAEALIRWHHPRLGLVYPGRFIDMAERTGMIKDIGRWVFESALYQLYLWQRRWPALRMQINVSVKQLLDENFFNICWDQLNRYPVKSKTVVLEITEYTLMEDFKRVRQLCDELSELGIVWAIDDFGTGYCSMSYLKQLPLTKLKVDRSFVADLEHSQESQTIVPAIIALGKALNMSITAEGVETPYQQEFLKQHGCDDMQGFLYSQAVPVKDFEHILEQA